jgi:hypothetical protein
MSDVYARLLLPAAYRRANGRLLKHDGQVVSIPADPVFWFHEKNDQTTVCPLCGPQSEGVFLVVPLKWLHGREDPDVQRIGEWLELTFWERWDYEEPK